MTQRAKEELKDAAGMLALAAMIVLFLHVLARFEMITVYVCLGIGFLLSGATFVWCIIRAGDATHMPTPQPPKAYSQIQRESEWRR